MGKRKRTLVIPLVTNNIFDFFKYALTTFFALGDRKIKTSNVQVL